LHIWQVGQDSFGCRKGGGKIFCQGLEPETCINNCGLTGCWNTNMRATALGLILCTVALPCSAQTVLKSEPLILAPYEVAFVQDASCPAGRVLKVTGAIRGLHRKKVCVTIGLEQATLSAATP
jgi:hypothetical protein